MPKEHQRLATSRSPAKALLDRSRYLIVGCPFSQVTYSILYAESCSKGRATVQG